MTTITAACDLPTAPLGALIIPSTLTSDGTTLYGMSANLADQPVGFLHGPTRDLSDLSACKYLSQETGQWFLHPPLMGFIDPPGVDDGVYGVWMPQSPRPYRPLVWATPAEVYGALDVHGCVTCRRGWAVLTGGSPSPTPTLMVA